MKKTFPEDRKLGEPERLRIFRANQATLKEISRKTGINDDEIKRRAIHVGLVNLAALLGIDVEQDKKAA